MLNYLDTIGQYYNTYEVSCAGDPTIYSNLVWKDGDTPISQSELDAVRLTDYKADKILEMSEYANEDIFAGFNSSALGTPHFYESEPEDQLNLIGAVAAMTDSSYSCKPLTQGYQVVNFGGTLVGTNPSGLANSVTEYNGEIQVGTNNIYVSVIGQNAQTITDLMTEIQADIDLAGFTNIVMTLDNGDLKFTNTDYGNTSTINIIDTTLFNNVTGYVSLDPAVDGLSGTDIATKIYIAHTHAQLLEVLNDGKDIKLFILQKFAVKKSQIINAISKAEVDSIIWE